MDDLIAPEHAARIGLKADTPTKYLRVLQPSRAGGLVVHEIYESIQGESTHAGRPCTFVRLSGCHLRCSYCDTPHAFGAGSHMSVEQVVNRVQELGVPLVELTGGEPLLQPDALTLMTELCDAGFEVLLETSGSLDIRPVDLRVKRIVDLKTPSSGEESNNLMSNLDALRPTDEVKLVVGDRKDYEWARQVVMRHAITTRCSVLVGCAFGKLEPAQLVDWILQDKLPVRFQLQLHKYVWDPAANGV